MWMLTGWPISTMAAQKRSSSSDTVAPEDGHWASIGVCSPGSAKARSNSARAASMPRVGIIAAPTRRSGAWSQ